MLDDVVPQGRRHSAQVNPDVLLLDIRTNILQKV